MYPINMVQVRLMVGLHHPHIVRLLGFCDEYNPEKNLVEQLLVYEFMPNGDIEAFIKNCEFHCHMILEESKIEGYLHQMFNFYEASSLVDTQEKA